MLGVLLALVTGVVLGVPAIILGAQSGGVSVYEGHSLSTGRSLDDEDSNAVAVGPGGGLVYSDTGSKVAILAGANHLEGSKAGSFGDFDESLGIATESTGRIYVSEPDDGSIAIYRGGGSPRLEGHSLSRTIPGDLRGDFEPQRLAASAGVVYAIDGGNAEVARFTGDGAYAGGFDGSGAPSGGFDFDADGEDTGIAVGRPTRHGPGDVYVVGDRPDGGSAVWGFSAAGRFLWEMPQNGRLDPCGVAVDRNGRLWVADSGSGAEQFSAPSGSRRAPRPTGRTAAEGSQVCGLAFAPGGQMYVASAPELLSTAANIAVQLATALGFLLVPFAIAASRGASPREGARRLGLRSFRPSALKWMAAAVGAYLLFALLYVAIVGEPHQEDIAKGFGAIPFQVLLIAVAAPVSEEVCFRGMLFGGLRERFPRILAALISGVIFGALHALTGISAVPPLIVFGFILALLYEKTGSVIPGILLHMLNNSVALLGQ